jgi:hypothetical protein
MTSMRQHRAFQPESPEQPSEDQAAETVQNYRAGDDQSVDGPPERGRSLQVCRAEGKGNENVGGP